MEHSLDGSDVESNYSGISNEDFEQLEDFEEPDEEPLSALEEAASDAEGVLSTGDAKGFPAGADAEVLSSADGEDVFSVGNAEEGLSASDAEDAMSVSDAEDGLSASDAEDGLPASDAEEGLSASDVEDVLSESGTENIYPESGAEDFMLASDAEDFMLASDAEDFMPSTNEPSDEESDGAVTERSSSPYVKEEPLSASDAEPPADNKVDKNFEEVHVKEESLASDAEPFPSIVKGTPGISKKDTLRGENDAEEHGSPYGLIRRQEADEGKFDPDDITLGGFSSLQRSKSTGSGTPIKSGGKRNKKPKNRKPIILPSPYTGLRVVDGEQLHCYYCNSSFKYKSRLERHIPAHFPPEYYCRECGKAFRLRRSFKNHLKLHYGVKQYKCFLCDFATHNLSSLRAHFARHEKKLSNSSEAVPSGYFWKLYDQPSVQVQMNPTSRTKWENKAKAQKNFPPPYTGPRQLGDGRFQCYYCPKAYKIKNLLGGHMYCHLPLEVFCKICGYGFSRFQFLQRHMENAHSEKKFSCQLCDFKAKISLSLKQHMTRMHVSPKVKVKKHLLSCFHCGWTTEYKSRLVYHMKRHRSELGQVWQVQLDNLLCGNCDYEAKTKHMLHKHIRSQHGDTVLKCAFCDYKTKISLVFMDHLGRHTGDEPLTCEVCGLRCLNRKSLVNHMSHHNDETDFKCPECPFASFSISSYIDHLKVHAVEPSGPSVEPGTLESSGPSVGPSTLESSAPSVEPSTLESSQQSSSVADVIKREDGGYSCACKLCYDTFDSISLFREHLDFHNRHFKCPYCTYGSWDKTTLDEHINAQHTKHKQYKCNFCEFKTPYMHQLKNHENAQHTRSNWYKCHFCDYQTLAKRYLTVHERRHSGYKPYACDICDYKSVTSESLVVHKLRHSGVRPFKCDSCDFSDFTKSGLQRHKQGVHSTERPFKCPFCGESFKTQQTAKLHETIHTGKKYPFSCSMCSFKTILKKSLDRHMLKMHPESPEEKELPDTYPNGRKKRWYFCSKCAFTTCSKPSLPHHMKKRHPCLSFENIRQEETGGRLERGNQCNPIEPPGRDSHNKSGAKQSRKSTKAKKIILPTPYTGPRFCDGKLLHCYYCQYSNRYKSRLSMHVHSHLPPEHICRKCGKAFHSQIKLKSHMSNVHSNIKRYRCYLCIYACTTKSRLKKHLGWHQRESLKTFGPGTDLIELNPTVFLDKYSVNNRASLNGQMTSSMRTRLKNKIKATRKLPPPYIGPRQLGGRFQCYHCPKSYAKKYTLRVHILKHLPLDFFCNECGFGFAKLGELRHHKSITHSSEKRFACHLCDFKTKWSQSLKYHLTKMHDDAPNKNTTGKPSLTCFYCGWSATYKSRMVDHVKRHLSRPKENPQPPKLGCPYCTYHAKTKSRLKSHVQSLHVEKTLKCEFCNFRSSNSSIMVDHTRKHTGETYAACQLCGCQCYSAKGLKNHMRLHNDNDFQCPVCPFATFKLYRYTEHLEAQHVNVETAAAEEHDEKPYACQLCLDIFETMAQFHGHVLSHHKGFNCPQCPFVTNVKATLKEHIKTQHTDTWYNCEFCDFKTKHKKNLSGHINSLHTQTIRFKCRFCDYQSLSRNSVRTHERRHTGEKPYVCDTCDYRCVQSGSLKSHKLTHTGELPFQCDLCDYRAASTSQISRHKKGVHAVQGRPFQCSFCGESFKTKQTAKLHELCHTGKQVYNCSECAFETFTLVCLGKHMSKMHSELPELPDTYPSGRKKTWRYCEKCAFAACSKVAFELHMKKRHPVHKTHKM